MTNQPPSSPDSGEVPLIERLRVSTAGRYEIHEEIGAGGMATVFKAREIALEREVAIKVMSLSITGVPGAVERFRREARVAAALSHPHIVPIYAIGEDPALAYFVMKYIEGRSLDAVLRAEGVQSFEFVRRTISVVGNALNYAHQRGVVHRDVKPANIMLDRDGWTYVTDFGIAKRDDGQGLTQSGTIIGTPAYMCPEQFNGAPITGAADQYSLGIVAFELLTGRAPFDGPSLGEVMRGHLLDAVPPVRTLRADVPPAVAACVTRMLAKDAADRFPTLADAAAAMEAANAGAPISPLGSEPRSAPNSDLSGPRHAPTTPMPQPARPREATGTERRPLTVSGERRPLTVSGERRPLTVSGERRPTKGASGGSFRLVALTLVMLALGGVYVVRFAPPAWRLDGAAPPVRSPVSDPDVAVPSAAVPAPTTPLVADTPSASPGAPPPTAPPVPGARRIPLDSVGGTPSDSFLEAAGAGRGGARQRLRHLNDRLAAAGQQDSLEPAIVRIGSQTLQTVLFVNGRQRGIVGGRGLISFPVPAGMVSLSIQRLGCQAWDTTFTAFNGGLYMLGERSPRC